MSANESKRRSGFRPLDETEAFQYQPLDEGIDCTRFLRINPASDDMDLISCDLVHIAFGARPTYDALSYRWGEEAVTQSIALNGRPFSVGKNLHDALFYLRNQGEVGLLWVDAICINQLNIQERNRQVSIMSHIYFRADTVVIWLGSAYSAHGGNTSPLVSSVTPDDVFRDAPLRSFTTSHPRGENDSASLILQRKMMLQLAKDEYWKRVWIIQEIGLAQNRRVCFGTTAMYWNDFITTMTLHKIPLQGPMLLDEEIDKRFQGSHRLKKLLSQHKHALCKDPRDKIYGLIGLAVDGHGFPKIDYNKSLFQIWKDTMEFMNSHQMFQEGKEDDIIEYGTLVKFLLMGVQSTPLQEVIRPYTTGGVVSFDTNEDEPGIFRIMGSLIGCIQSVGPSAKDIVGEVKTWVE
ncbi:HET domain-containing protein [Colletotrichum scovillei]|nr:HET domain-containing protein [Colletotrichum scovillei]